MFISKQNGDLCQTIYANIRLYYEIEENYQSVDYYSSVGYWNKKYVLGS